MNNAAHNRVNIIGVRYGRLLVLDYFSTVDGKAKWLCECDCGKYGAFRGDSMKRGLTRSCGCQSIEKAKERSNVHRMCFTPEYRAWGHFISRCFNPKDYAYRHYGGRGITVCEEWKNSFISFYQDMGPKPGPEFTIDRIDNNGNYCKENCRWATMKEQSRNVRNNRFVEYNGINKCVAEWAEMANINYATLLRRLNKGWSVGQALGYEPRNGKYYFNNLQGTI